MSVKWSFRLCIYLLARPPPGGRLGIFSVAMLLRTDTRSGTPASPQFPSSSTHKYTDRGMFVPRLCCILRQGYYIPLVLNHHLPLQKVRNGKKSDTPLLPICSSMVQQSNFKYLYYLKNVYFVLDMSTETEHSRTPLVLSNLSEGHWKDGWAQRTVKALSYFWTELLLNHM